MAHSTSIKLAQMRSMMVAQGDPPTPMTSYQFSRLNCSTRGDDVLADRWRSFVYRILFNDFNERFWLDPEACSTPNRSPASHSDT